MIRQFKVVESGVIEPTTLRLSRGLNCFTGETGTGKTVFLNLFANCLGYSFTLPEDMNGIYELLFDQGDSVYNVRLYLSNNRKKFEVNGSKFSQRQVKDIFKGKVVFSSQFEAQTLDLPEALVMLVDAYAGTDDLRSVYASAFNKLRTLTDKVSETKKRMEESARVKESLKEELAELIDFGPQLGEYEQLKNLLLKLSERDRIVSHLRSISSILEEESPFLRSLFEIRASLLVLSQFYPEAQNALLCLDELRFGLKPVLELRADDGNGQNLTIDQINDRLFRYEKYFRRYGVGEGSILNRVNQLEDQLRDIESLPTTLKALEHEIEIANANLNDIGQRLTTARRACIERLTPDFSEFLGELRIDGTLQWEWLPTTDSPLGPELPTLTLVRGQTRTSVAKLSGGERSRLIFVIKVLLSPSGSVLVFDEPDAGIGGETLSRLAQLLKRISRDRQLLLITHNPQVAASASHHYVVEKLLSNSKMHVKIYKVMGEERVQEIAKMIAGQYVTATTLEQAVELIRTLSGGDFGE